VGLVPTLESLYDDPDFLAAAFRLAIDYDREMCRQLVAHGADVIWITEDVASAQGPLLSPLHYRRQVLPYLCELLDAIRALGKPAVLHSDGNMMPFLDDLVEAGIAGLNPLEAAAGMDLAVVKRRYGDRLCLMGNVDNKTVLTRGNPQQIEQCVKDCIRTAGAGGGYILMSDNAWHAGVPVERAQAMVTAGHTWGQYPLKGLEDA
jgi:uroporphyrinogen decarboxylase